MKRSPNERHTQTHGRLIETFRKSQMSLSIRREYMYMNTRGKDGGGLLLMEKDFGDCRNVSINLPCVCVCLLSGNIFIFSVRDSSSFSYF